MPSVTAEITVDAPVKTVYDIARNIERFPEFMDDVVSVEILEQTPERQVSRWKTLIKEFHRNLNWVEVDYWDEETRTCRWELTEGDLKRYDGNWEFTETEGGGTRAKVHIDYEIEVPLIGALLKKIVRAKMQANVDSMLAAIKREAEAA